MMMTGAGGASFLKKVRRRLAMGEEEGATYMYVAVRVHTQLEWWPPDGERHSAP